MEKDTEYIKHESYGMIGFSRVHGKARFYGSELEQDNYIEMKVYHSEVRRELSREWFHTDGHTPIIRLRMSASQFAEMITNMNVGDGVPCTLESIQGVQMQTIPNIDNRKEFVHRQFKARMVEFAKGIKSQQQRALQLVEKKTLSKMDVHDLTMYLNHLTTELTSNIPFFMECFQETMDHVVQEAKLEVENAIQHKIMMLGLESLEVLKEERKQIKK